MKGENRILRAGDSENYSWKEECPWCKAEISVVNTECIPRCKFSVSYGFMTNCPSCASYIPIDDKSLKQRDIDSWDFICTNSGMDVTQRAKRKLFAEDLIKADLWCLEDPQVWNTLRPEQQEEYLQKVQKIEEGEIDPDTEAQLED